MTIRLDVHTHLAPIAPEALADLAGVSWDGAARRLTIDGHTLKQPALLDPDQLVEWLDANAIDRALVSVPPPLYRQHLTVDAAKEWCGYLRLALSQLGHDGRLVPLYHLPAEHPRLAADLVTGIATDGPARFAMATGAPAVTLSADSHRDLWRALDACDAFVFLHPAEGCDPRLDAFYLHNLIGNPHETAIAAAHLVFGGIIDLYPAIRFCLAHGGGTVPALAGRWRQGHATARPGLDAAALAPSAGLGRLCVDCLTHDPAMVDQAATIFGASRIAFGSDWPFPMGLLDPAAFLATLSTDVRKAITAFDID